MRSSLGKNDKSSTKPTQCYDMEQKISLPHYTPLPFFITLSLIKWKVFADNSAEENISIRPIKIEYEEGQEM